MFDGGRLCGCWLQKSDQSRRTRCPVCSDGNSLLNPFCTHRNCVFGFFWGGRQIHTQVHTSFDDDSALCRVQPPSRSTHDTKFGNHTQKEHHTLRFMYCRAERFVSVLTAPTLTDSSSTCLPAVVSKSCVYVCVCVYAYMCSHDLTEQRGTQSQKAYHWHAHCAHHVDFVFSQTSCKVNIDFFHYHGGGLEGHCVIC